MGCRSGEEPFESGYHRVVVALLDVEDGGVSGHVKGRRGKYVVRPRVCTWEGHLSVAQEGVGVKLSDHDVVEEGVRMGVVEIA